MEVKMQYVVDLEDIPTEALILLPTGDWDEEYSVIGKCLKEGNVPKALQAIDKARRQIYRADRRLVDIHSILGGYLEVKTQASKPAQQQDINLEDAPELFGIMQPSDEEIND